MNFELIGQKIIHQPAPVRLLLFTGVLLILWLPLAIPIYLLLQADSNLTTIITMALLFAEILFLWRFWGKFVYQEPNIFARYGLSLTAANRRDFLNGIALGFWVCLGLFIVEAILGWVQIRTPSATLVKIVAEGFLSAVGIGLAEELLFRGWLLDELQQDYSRKTTLWVSALVFAILHFIKPIAEFIRTLVTFPALVLLGIILVLAKRRHGDRLGICIGIHSGLVWGYYILNVGQLIEYSGSVPSWVTGIDGNPIAGVMGLLFLAGLAVFLRRK